MSSIKPRNSNKKSKPRFGRGIGTGNGKTCGKGHKGQKSRSGGSIPLTFEGGQNPLVKRKPKSGFVSRKSLFSVKLPLSVIITIAEQSPDVTINLELLKKLGIIKKTVLYVKVYNNLTDDPKKLNFKLEGIRVTTSIQEIMDK